MKAKHALYDMLSMKRNDQLFEIKVTSLSTLSRLNRSGQQTIQQTIAYSCGGGCRRSRLKGNRVQQLKEDEYYISMIPIFRYSNTTESLYHK